MSFSAQHSPRKIQIKIKAQQNYNKQLFKQRNSKSPQTKKLSLSRPYSPCHQYTRKPIYTKPLPIIQQITQLVKSCSQSRFNIQKGLQFIKLIQNFNQQQRCLQHNNVITLYCLNDKKLLCVSCIYGIHKHRNHKLLPTIEYVDMIAEDVVKLQQKYQDEIQKLENVIDKSKSTTQNVQSILKRILVEIQQQYIRRKQQLQSLYEKQKLSIISLFTSIIQRTQQIFNINQQIKFNIWQYQAKYSLDKTIKINFDILKNKNNIDSNMFNKQYKDVLTKHVVFSHLVQEMKKVKIMEIEENKLEARIFNRRGYQLLQREKKNGRVLKIDDGWGKVDKSQGKGKGKINQDHECSKDNKNNKSKSKSKKK